MEIKLKNIWMPLGIMAGWIIYVIERNYIPIKSVCPFNKFLHIKCTGCGVTRMTDSLLHIQIYQAFRYNPFIFITSPFILFMILVVCGVVVIKEEYYKIYYTCLTVFTIGAILFMVLRNTLMPGLAPTIIN